MPLLTLIHGWLRSASGASSHALHGPLCTGWWTVNSCRPFSSQRGVSLAARWHLDKLVMLVLWPNIKSHDPFNNFFRVIIHSSVSRADFPPDRFMTLRFCWTCITVDSHVYFTSMHMEACTLPWQSSTRLANLFPHFKYVITLAT